MRRTLSNLSFALKSQDRSEQPTAVQLVLDQLERRRHHRVWFVYLLSLTQLVVLMMVTITDGYESFGLLTTAQRENFTVAGTESGKEEVTVVGVPNIWLGPSTTALLASGATFAPCMRPDALITVRLDKMQDIAHQGRCCGCCAMPVADGSVRGVPSDQRKCTSLYKLSPSDFYGGLSCGEVMVRTGLVLLIDLGACCTSHLGHCEMLTISDCRGLLGGSWHRSRNCGQVNCLAHTCGRVGMQADPSAPYKPIRPNQWYRFLVSPFLHAGYLQLFLVINLQIHFGCTLEKNSGWVRLIAIYLCSAFGGCLFSSLLTPYSVQLGSFSAVFGLQACYAVELVQLWRILKHPIKDVVALSSRLFLFLIVGLFPGFNNFANIGGFIYGLLSSVALLRPVTFSNVDAFWKRKLRFIAIFLFVALSTVMLLFFFLFQDAIACRTCAKWNCLPLNKDFCQHQAGPDPSSTVLYSKSEADFYKKLWRK